VFDAEGEAWTCEDALEASLDPVLERALVAARCLVKVEDRLELRFRDRLPIRSAGEAAQDLRGAVALASRTRPSTGLGATLSLSKGRATPFGVAI
jgi:hypothetical protein